MNGTDASARAADRDARDRRLLGAAAFLRACATGTTGIVVGAALKVTYDLLLYLSFRGLVPPEERRP